MAHPASLPVALAFLAAVAACDPGTDPPRPPCTGRLSGAVTGAFTCQASGTHAAGADASTVRFDLLAHSGTALDLLLDGVTFPGAPAVRTVTDQTAGVSAYNEVFAGTVAAPVLYFTVRDDTTLPDLGTFSLTVTSADAVPAGAPAGAYLLHGRLTATMAPFPANPAAGTVTLELEF
jgi:hypothetical protein